MVAAYFLAKKYEPEVRDIVVYELNRILEVEVKVDDINLSLLQRFPYASLRFSNVVIPEPGADSDTLLYASDVYLQISLWDFLRKHYRVSEADVNGGFFRMKIDERGKGNYTFWKEGGTEESSLISLNDIETNDFDFSLQTAAGIDLSLGIAHAQSRGRFGSEVYDLASECRLVLRHFAQKGDTLYRELPVSGKFNVNINHLEGLHRLSSEALSLGKATFGIAGSHNPANKGTRNLSISAENANIEHALALLPLSMRKGLQAYKARGKSDLLLEVEHRDDTGLAMDFIFERTRGSFQHDKALGKATLDKATGSVQVRNERVSLYIDHAEGSMGPGKLSVGGSIRNLAAAEFDLRVNGKADLRELRNFFDPEYIEEMAGKLHMAGTISGRLPAGAPKNQAIKSLAFDGDIRVEQAALQLRAGQNRFEKLNAQIGFRDNAFSIREASAEVNGNPFTFSGSISNALPYLIDDREKLYIAADFSTESLDLNRIWDTSSSRRDTTYKFSLPQSTDFDFRLDVGKVLFRRFTAEEVSGTATYRNGKLLLEPIRFRVAGGLIQGRAEAGRQSETLYHTAAILQLTDIDMSRLFYAFENFGQEVITHSQISGRANAQVNFGGMLRDDLSYDLSSIKAHTDLMVTKGKLQRVEALQEVADYMRQHAVWRNLVKVDAFEQELAAVHFDTLRNTIDIRDRRVIIPSMRVGSSALSLNLSGEHSFDHEIDYRLNFRLGELLRTGRKKEDEFGYITDDGAGLRLFLRMSGTVDEPIFSLDKESARQRRKDELQDEKKRVKGMLKEDFGLFKGDTAVIAPSGKGDQGAPHFDVEWEDAPSGQKKQGKDKKKGGLLSPKEDSRYDELDGDDDL